jgi:hypothetical protein
MNNEYIKTRGVNMKEYVEVSFYTYYDDGMGSNDNGHYTYFLLKEDVQKVRDEIWKTLLTHEDYYGVDYYKTTDCVSIESVEDMYLCYLVEAITDDYDVLELKGEIHANIIGSTSIILSAGRHQYLLSELEDYAYKCGFDDDMPTEERGEIIEKLNEYVDNLIQDNETLSALDISLYDDEEE